MRLFPGLFEPIHNPDDLSGHDLSAIYGPEPGAKPTLDPLEAITGFELMLGLMGYAVLWCWRFLCKRFMTDSEKGSHETS